MFAVHHSHALFLLPTVQLTGNSCENPRCHCRIYEVTLHFLFWTVGITWQCNNEGGPV